MSRAGRVCSERELLRQVWGYPPETADLSLVRWHVRKLRERVESDPGRPTYIRTVPRHGYMLAIPAERSGESQRSRVRTPE